jgi:predicted component of type VI protein secretion system
MPAQLVALSEGPDILLDKPVLLLGRHPECDIQIDSRKVSRRHCCIAQVNDRYIVRDLGSTNGIRINGVRMTEGHLRHGDELTIGSHRYQVRLPGEARAGLRAPARGTERAEPADDLLESCDEPVPLAESGAPAIPVSPAPRGQAPRPDVPAILPEQIELRPTGDSYPEIPGASGVRPGR